jgi:hypothetical protein
MRLFDYIDEQEAEKLIGQHDSFEWHGCLVERKWKYSGNLKEGRWFVFWVDTSCIESALRPSPIGAFKGYATLAEGLQVAYAYALELEEKSYAKDRQAP